MRIEHSSLLISTLELLKEEGYARLRAISSKVIDFSKFGTYWFDDLDSKVEIQINVTGESSRVLIFKRLSEIGMLDYEAPYAVYTIFLEGQQQI